jgi:hypothetical protein
MAWTAMTPGKKGDNISIVNDMFLSEGGPQNTAVRKTQRFCIFAFNRAASRLATSGFGCTHLFSGAGTHLLHRRTI